MTKVTEKEMAFLTQVSKSEFVEWVDDGEGWIGDWVCCTDYDMKVVRGLMSSLEQKKIVIIGDHMKGFQGQDMTWVSIYSSYCDFNNYCLIGLEVV